MSKIFDSFSFTISTCFNAKFELLETIFNSQVDLTELYTEPSYDDLKEALQNYLNPSDDGQEETSETTTTAKTTQTAAPTKTEEKKTANVEDAFDQLFNS